MERDAQTPVKAKAYLIDARSMSVVWMNEAAEQDLAGSPHALPAPVTAAIPLAETLGVPEALADVAATGAPRHLQTSLVSTSRGGLAIVASVYRLPDGGLLLLIETAWEPRHGRTEGTPRRSPRHR